MVKMSRFLWGFVLAMTLSIAGIIAMVSIAIVKAASGQYDGLCA